MAKSGCCEALKCQKMVSSGIQCDCRGYWYYQDCARIERNAYEAYVGNDTLQWLCYICLALAEGTGRQPNLKAGSPVVKIRNSLDSQLDLRKIVKELAGKGTTLEKELSLLKKRNDIAMDRNTNIII
ncbi:unnamed protein product [Echinostoma caproni]|uniref:PHD domain-containing protein n=1 Tax=Echinostoma caproni TaxID=27848 RepID=A0A183BEA4_9TREM|nr:unnamed protein product [Echinostoma caproni]